MEPGNPDDPLLRQVLPVACEHADHPGFSTDPVGDAAATIGPGLLQKYQGRALLVTTPACAIHCRYCFRRHYPYAQASLGADAGASAIAGIASDATIREVILSGGDPLMLDDAAADVPCRQVGGHPPSGTAAPAHPIAGRPAQPCHHRPLRDPGADAVADGGRHPCQSPPGTEPRRDRVPSASCARPGSRCSTKACSCVGSTTTANTLSALSNGLFRDGVLPYYLHLLDRVQGAAHFEVPLTEALDLMAELRLRLPGYLVPRLVREDPGAGSKIALS